MSEPEPASASVHKPVLLREVLHAVAPGPGDTVVDGTVGAAGHAAEIARRLGPDGKLFGFDRDPMMLGFAETRLADAGDADFELYHRPYDEIAEALPDAAIGRIDAALLDLGYSSDQISDDSRGFRFDSEGPFDLRFDTSAAKPAATLLDEVDVATLTAWLEKYGEIPAARRLAERIFTARPITSARHFAETVAAASSHTASPGRHPATQAFQALRIAVNDELGRLERFLSDVAPQILRPGGRLAVISFHSLEDRIVKSAFRDSGVWTITSPKPITGRPAEVRANPRARSAKLRVATRGGPD
ncbi:MAG: 16S rRNA (cytosine(1402)-N(4))-methyltransferase RsmH [Planctomycetota bacterium]